MIDEQLQELAALYASGAMLAKEREELELILEFHCELRAHVGKLLDTATAVALATQRPIQNMPSCALKLRILTTIAEQTEPVAAEEGFVITGTDGLVRWVNPAFMAMCGYTCDELRGRKLGQLLQGSLTNLETAQRMREAVHTYLPCCETLINYHKNGTPYWVEVRITPILADQGQPRLFIAREREITDRTIFV